MRTDEELVLEFRQGSSDSFTELFHRYREPVYGFFCRPLSDPARAEELARQLRRLGHAAPVTVEAWEREKVANVLKRCQLVVNATTLGMKHSPDEKRSILEGHALPAGVAIYDVVANPLVTPLLAQAKRQGAPCLGGFSMLIYQGATAFELWTGLEAPVEVMLNAGRAAMGL